MNKIFVKHPGNTTTIAIFTKVGARYEPANIKGISHVVEHMLFKGTPTRTAKEISYEIEKYGAEFNAYTDWEITNYYIDIETQHVEKVLPILRDMLYNPKFDQDELTKELKVILEELKMYEDNPQEAVWELFYANLVETDDGFHMPIIGTRKTLANIDRQTLLNFYKEYYHPDNLTIIAVGDISVPTIDENLDARIPSIDRIKTKSIVGRVFQEIHRKGLTQTNALIGNVFQNNRTILENYFLNKFLESVLNDMSGRLFTEIREKHNLVYRVSCGTDLYRCGTSIWTISLGLSRSNLNLAHDLALKELNSLRDISDKELDYAATKLIGSFALSLNSSQNVASLIAPLESLGIDFRKVIYGYADEIKEAKKLFKDFASDINFNNNLVTAISPEEE